MHEHTTIPFPHPQLLTEDPLTEVVRQGAQRLLAQAIEAEVAMFLARYADRRDAQGRHAVVRNGSLPEREVHTGVGAVRVKVPRVRDRSGTGLRFHSALLPPYLRRSQSLAALLPWLSLQGVSTGDFWQGKSALITASATLYPSGLAHGSPRWTEGRRRYLDGCQDRGKHRPRLLPEKPLRRGRPVWTREEKVVHRRQTCPLSGVVESSQLMVPQREVPVAPFHIGAGALEHLRELWPSALSWFCSTGLNAPNAPPGSNSGVRRRSASARSGSPCGHRPRRGHALKIIRGNEMGVHGVGHGRRQVQLTHLLPHIPRDELDGRLHFGHHALGFLDPLQARLAEVFLLGNGADRVDVLLDIPGNELAVATHAALQVDKVVGVADGADALGDLSRAAR